MAELAAPLAAFVVPLTVYAATICSQPARWDTAELQGTPYIMGIPHATGFPLYVLVAYAFSHLVPIGTAAFRTGLFSAMCVAGACVLLYAIARELGVAWFCALPAAWWFGVIAAVWQRAARAEVHDLALLLSAFAVYFAVRWIVRGDERELLAVFAAIGLGVATHPVTIWLLPGAVAAALLGPRRAQRRTLLACGALVVAGLALYAYLPLRSAYVVAHGLDPTSQLAGVHGGIFWNFNDPRTLDGLIAEVTGSRFSAGSILLSALNPANVQDAFGYWLVLTIAQYGAVGFVLAAIGLVQLWRRDWRITVAVALFGVAALPFAYVWASSEGDPDRYRLPALWVVALFIACAAGFGSLRYQRAWNGLLAIIIVALGLHTFAQNRYLFNNHTDFSGRFLIERVTALASGNAIVLAPWIDATTLAYAAYVDGTLSGRIIVPAAPDEYARYFAHWPPERRIYLVAPPNTRIPGVRLRTAGPIDTSRFLYEVMRN
jgi:4-amino-4-deoxy-L-arabinose transferase-like glycosyltransferase